MKGIFINCPSSDCKKMLLKNAYLRIGSYLTIRCYHCGALVILRAEEAKITLRLVEDPRKQPEDEDDPIIFIHG